MTGWRINWVDYYSVLEVDRNASFDLIKKKYRKLVAKYHPDVCEDTDAHEKTALINEAYSVLSDKAEKEEYDKVWDARKNGTYNENEAYNDQGNVNYEDVKNNYTAEEKRYAKREALKKIIEEELQKVDLIINSKSEIIFDALNIDKKEYYMSVKELVRIGYDFINQLNELMQEAYKYDLFEEEELISQAIEFLNKELKDIPLTQKDVKIFTEKEIYKDVITKKVEEEIEIYNEIIDKLNSLLMCSYQNQITYLEYKNVLESICLEAKKNISELRQLVKITNDLGLQQLSEQILDASSSLDAKLIATPSDFDEAKKAGERLYVKNQLISAIKQADECLKRIEKVKHTMSKHPDAKGYERLYEYGITIIDDSLNELNNVKNISSKVSDKINLENEKVIQLSNEAIKLYNDAEQLHKNANELYSSKQQKKFDNKSQLYTLSKSAYSVWDKSRAFEMMLKSSEMLGCLDNLSDHDEELIKLNNLIIENINLINKSKVDLINNYNIDVVNPYAKYTIDELYAMLEKLEEEIKTNKNASLVVKIIGTCTAIGALILTFTKYEELWTYMVTPILYVVSAAMFFASSDIKPTKTEEEKAKILERINKINHKK